MPNVRGGAAVSSLAALALVVASCGSDDNVDQTGIEIPDVECHGESTLSASGSTAQANAMVRFINIYEAACQEHSLDYNSSGSGAGVTEFLGGQTDFGGTDIPLQEGDGEVSDAVERCGGNEAWNIPLVFGPIAVTYNLEGVDDIALDGPAMAGIFDGSITHWNDPQIAELNEDQELPDTEITVIFRSDESGTTDLFQQYLDAASDGAWEHGTGKVFQGGTGEGAQGNENTSAAVDSTPGSITYNEWSFAQQHNLQTASLINAAGGEPVALDEESAAQAIDEVEVIGEGNDLRLDLDSLFATEVEGAYPLVLAAYEIVCSTYPDPEVGQAVATFLELAATFGQQGLDDAGYVPLPEDFRERLLSAIDDIS